MLYYEGKGVDKDLRWAYYWLTVAALQGDDIAQEHLKTVAAGMPREQIKEAETQAKDWMEKAKKGWK
jgi:TPR repeat protein